MFSKACEYGIKAMIFLAANEAGGEVLNLEVISDKIDSPISFTSKVLQKLAKAGLVKSSKGPHGGFRIEEKILPEISLLDIVNAIDGSALLNNCGLGLKSCNSNKPCPIHHDYAAIRSDIKHMLQKTLLRDFMDKKKQHQFVLTR